MASDDAIGSFAQDGVAVIRSVIQPELLATLRRDIGEVRSAAAVTAPDQFLNWKSFESFEEAALRSPLPEHAADFLDSFKIRFYFDRVLGTASDQLGGWQQEEPQSGVDSRSITAWLALDAIGKEDSPEFWAGSQLGSWYLGSEMLDIIVAPEGETVEKIPDLTGDDSSYDTRRWALEPGDVVFASSLTVHSLPKSLGALNVMSFTYVDAQAAWIDRAWDTIPASDLVRGEAEAGEALDPERFPVAWPQGD